jgi:fatty acid desaturase/SAM-dependent methyltransferase
MEPVPASSRRGGTSHLAGSPDLQNLAVTSQGETWAQYRGRLTPYHGIVWRDIGLIYLMMVMGLLGHAWMAPFLGTTGAWMLVPVTGMWLGFWAAALSNFLHEAAHFNIHPDKRANDRLANWTIGGWVAQDVSQYRKVHWAHHLHLGSPEDTEVSYHNAPTLWFLFLSLTGLHALRVLARHRNFHKDEARGSSWPALLRFAALHGSVLAIVLASGHGSLGLAWGAGWLLFFPFFVSLRQILEHRDATADPNVDYRHAVHGPHNRLFGTDLFSCSFGSAGFNRHLLHHWDPAISYTRFDDMLAFLRQTALADTLAAAQTTYTQTLRSLMKPTVGTEADQTAPVPCPVCASERTAAFAQAWDSEYHTSADRYTYRRCQACGVVFLPDPPVARLREIYPPNYYAYTPAATQSLLHRFKNYLDGGLFRRLIADLPGDDPVAVLDVGGGTGWLAGLIRSQNPRVQHTHVVDLDESAQAAAQASGHGFSACRIEDFQAARSFDLILLLNLIEHVADPAAVLSRLAGVMSARGRLLIKTPNTDTLSCRLFRHHNWGGFHCPRHWVLFHRQNFEALAARCGLRVLWTKYTQGAPQWTTSILGWLADSGWIRITKDRPAHVHPLYTPLLTVTALLDFFLKPFLRPSQMFVLLERQAEASSARVSKAA